MSKTRLLAYWCLILETRSCSCMPEWLVWDQGEVVTSGSGGAPVREPGTVSRFADDALQERAFRDPVPFPGHDGLPTGLEPGVSDRVGVVDGVGAVIARSWILSWRHGGRPRSRACPSGATAPVGAAGRGRRRLRRSGGARRHRPGPGALAARRSAGGEADVDAEFDIDPAGGEEAGQPDARRPPAVAVRSWRLRERRVAAPAVR